MKQGPLGEWSGRGPSPGGPGEVHGVEPRGGGSGATCWGPKGFRCGRPGVDTAVGQDGKMPMHKTNGARRSQARGAQPLPVYKRRDALTGD